MNLAVTGVNNYRSRVNDELGMSAVMASLNELWAARQDNISAAMEGLNRAFNFCISRCNGEFDSSWLFKVSALIDNLSFAIKEKMKQGYTIKKKLLKRFFMSCLYADESITAMILEDEKKFSKLMSHFNSRALYNSTGVEKVRKANETFGVVDTEIDPDCTYTTMMLNSITRNSVETMDEADIAGWVSELKYYDNVDDMEEDLRVEREKPTGSVISLRIPNTDHGIMVSMTEVQTMEDPCLISPDVLWGVLYLLDDYAAQNKDPNFDGVFIDRLKDFYLEVEKCKTEREKITCYLNGCKDYSNDLEDAAEIMTKYNIPKVISSWAIDEYPESVKLVGGMLSSGEHIIFEQALIPESEETMFIETADYDAFVGIVQSINSSYERLKFYYDEFESRKQDKKE